MYLFNEERTVWWGGWMDGKDDASGAEAHEAV
jgi:hypothetical protein